MTESNENVYDWEEHFASLPTDILCELSVNEEHRSIIANILKERGVSVSKYREIVASEDAQKHYASLPTDILCELSVPEEHRPIINRILKDRGASGSKPREVEAPDDADLSDKTADEGAEAIVGPLKHGRIRSTDELKMFEKIKKAFTTVGKYLYALLILFFLAFAFLYPMSWKALVDLFDIPNIDMPNIPHVGFALVNALIFGGSYWLGYIVGGKVGLAKFEKENPDPYCWSSDLGPSGNFQLAIILNGALALGICIVYVILSSAIPLLHEVNKILLTAIGAAIGLVIGYEIHRKYEES